ncbi:MAG: endolytic transglycosylase MltG [Anaerolineales bacterium]|nr:endolytic transglycosylase MltG [Anaerolineales bacterium]MCX7609707.1 endolytic transglycosylase MltG [Anaerolineales bacterium]MDW8227546.1 endolytic transglycosylase MltG [Anaerolineales bacterium]
MRRGRRRLLSAVLWFLSFLALFLLSVGFGVPALAEKVFGAPSASLPSWQRFYIGAQLLLHADLLLTPHNAAGEERLFVIQPGESVLSISNRLEQMGLIPDARLFRLYLIWSGMDSSIQVGTFRLNSAMTARSIAETLQSAERTEVKFTVLAGWRLEEVAASLPTSGLEISPEAFLMAAASPPFSPDLIPAGASAEGFLYPDTYILPRTTTAKQLVSVLVQTFFVRLPPEYLEAYAARGLTLYQAVTLASIIEREAVVDDEMPLIASVFYNRLAAGMMLQTDPTVQYALGFIPEQNTWWKTPLAQGDLQVNSPYNTYLVHGLPPGPICSPGVAALRAVAYPAESPYFYFQAKCDRSGLHNFAVTFEEHRQNYCP